MSENDELEFQVKVPVCVTLYLTRKDVERMYRKELAEVAGAVLEAWATPADMVLSAMTSQGAVRFKYQVNPHYDNLPPEELDLVFEDEADLFPQRD